MIEFKRPQLEDRSWMEPYLRGSGFRSCEYTFTNLYTWAGPYLQSAAVVEGFLVVRTDYDGGSYSWGAGSGSRRDMILALYHDAQQRGVPFRLWGMTEEQCQQIEDLFPGMFTFQNFEDGADYCYTAEKLATLSGKKLHAKRNHIHRFEDNFPDWRVEEITEENLSQCLIVAQDWEKEETAAGLDDWEERAGEAALHKAAKHYRELGLEGLILYGEDKPLAFTMGQPISGDTYDVIFEKAYGEVQGAYAMINREFARWVQKHYPEIVYLNREDDMGEPNLRKAKLSYHPDLMVNKYLASLKDGAVL